MVELRGGADLARGARLIQATARGACRAAPVGLFLEHELVPMFQMFVVKDFSSASLRRANAEFCPPNSGAHAHFSAARRAAARIQYPRDEAIPNKIP